MFLHWLRYIASKTAGWSFCAPQVHLDTTFPHQFADVFVGERIAEISAHAQNNHFSRIFAAFERIVRVDRH